MTGWDHDPPPGPHGALLPLPLFACFLLVLFAIVYVIAWYAAQGAHP